MWFFLTGLVAPSLADACAFEMNALMFVVVHGQ
jgi:hypothetical protein